MKHASIIVRATWDDEAEVSVATSKDVEGLAVEAETIEMLEPKVVAAISDLLELNSQSFDLPESRSTSCPSRSPKFPTRTTDGDGRLSAAGCRLVRTGKGDHEIWFSPITNRHFTVDHGVKSRHTANEH